MNLPKNYIKSQQGQILVLFLLILVVSLAIIISISSRSITNIRLTTTTDESNRAYYAAEAGIEEALHQVHSDPTGAIDIDLTFDDIHTTANAKEVGDGFAPNPLVFQGIVDKDDVVQANLLTDFSVLTSGSFVTGLEIHWGGDTNDPETAVEVSVVSYDAGTWGISKLIFDPDPIRAVGTTMCTDSNIDYTTHDHDGINFSYSAQVNFTAGSEACGPPITPLINSLNIPLDKAVLVRVRTLYKKSPIAIGFIVGSAGSFPTQGTIIESIGETASGVTRKLRVEKFYPALPAIFDYVLFSGGCKTPDLATGICTEYYPLSK